MTMHYPKSRAEWLALRHRYVSSTESSALFGLNKYCTAFELAVRKKSSYPDDSEESERTRAGLALQLAISRLFAEDHSVKVRAMNGYATLDDHRMGASYDFEIIGAEGDTPVAKLYASHGPGVLEIKNVDSWIYKNEWIDGEAPAHIEIQLQQQLACAGRKWGVIAALVGGNRMETQIRMIDWPVVDRVIAKVGRFWADLGAGIMPPVVLPEDLGILTQVYGHAEPGKVMEAAGNDSITAQCFDYATAAADEKAAKERKDTAKAKLLMLIGDHEKVLADGYTISAGVVGEAVIEQYTRKAYRTFKVTARKAQGKAA